MARRKVEVSSDHIEGLMDPSPQKALEEASNVSENHFSADQHFDWLRHNGVSFYEPVVRPVPPPVFGVYALMQQDELGFSSA